MTEAPLERPSWREVALGLAVTVLTASQLMNFRSMETAQTASNYYRDEAGVLPLQYAALTLNALIFVCIAAWVFTSMARVLLPLILSLAVAGFGVAWTELFLALRHASGPLYELTGLPYRPVNNLGVIGASVFAGYLIFRLPDGRMRPFPATLVKAAFVACAFIVQLVLWSSFSARFGVAS